VLPSPQLLAEHIGIERGLQVRVGRLQETIKTQELDALLVTRPENMRYLSGFTGGEGAVLITPDRAMLLTDFRYYDQVAEESPDFELVKVEAKVSLVLKQRLRELEIMTLGFESTHIPFAWYQEWEKATRGTKWIPTEGVVQNMRLVKDELELELLRRAVDIADQACDHIRGYVEPGMSEKQVAWELESFMRTHGAEAASFPFIVASGPNSAKVHAVPLDRPILNGEPIVMDMGARFDGYCSDLTRTICIGEPDEKLQGIYDIVLQAQLAAEEGAQAGMTCKEVDALARDIISERGYAEQFGHALGHGVGLAIHEDPRLSWLSDIVLEAGMVCTIEPGIYISGWGGVRIEDIVVMREDGVEILSQARKELRAR
jgi:Xaa-Pro aminopeptidase